MQKCAIKYFLRNWDCYNYTKLNETNYLLHTPTSMQDFLCGECAMCGVSSCGWKDA